LAMALNADEVHAGGGSAQPVRPERDPARGSVWPRLPVDLVGMFDQDEESDLIRALRPWAGERC
jgi:bifunctional ADP-heptose synthase (sugar kinase/adenylyltransferase)